MKKPISILLYIIFMTISLIASDTKLSIGIYPYKDNLTLYNEYKPLIKHLSEKLNIEIDFIISKDYKNLIELFKTKKVDIALFGAYNYIKAKRVVPNMVYLATKQELKKNKLSSSYNSVIISLKKSNIKELKQLKGKIFGFTDFNSTSGYLFPLIALKKQNIKLSDLKNYYMLKKHTRVMQALTRNSIDAAATYYGNYQEFMKKNGNIYNILYTSEDIPHESFFANESLKKNFRDKIKKEILEFKSTTEKKSIHSYVEIDMKIYDKILEKEKFLE